MRRKLQIYSIAVALALLGWNVSAQESPRDTTSTHAKSKVKRQMKRDTPGDRSNNPQDLEVMRKIRAEIIDQDGMSVNARNIKIIAVDGRVTLRGPVNTEEEKLWIAEIAAKFATPGSIDNQLDVKHTSDRK